MRSVKITVKNYRCFSDENPLRIELRGGVVAFIGPNNSGKSAALKFFYECRNLWSLISSQLTQVGNSTGLSWAFTYLYPTDDPERVFNFTNTRDISISFDFEPINSQLSTVEHVQIIIDRRTQSVPKITMKTSDGVTFDSIKVLEGGIAVPMIGASQQIFPRISLEGLEIFSALANSFYIGAFRNAINQSGNNIPYYDIQVGKDFVTLWDTWKNGIGPQSSRNAKKILGITKTIREMYRFSQLDINPTNDNQGFIVSIEEEMLPLSEVGSGLAQCLIVLSNLAIKSPRMVLIDEPELNLHPALQQRFMGQISEFAPDGIIFATHSLGLARSTAENIYSFDRAGWKTTVHQYEGIPNLVEFLGEMSFASQKEIGYDRILLVEGLHDVKVFKVFLRLFGLEHKTVVLFMGGNQMAAEDREHELTEIRRLSDKVFAIVDSERDSSEGPPSDKRLAFQATCQKVGISVLLTEYRATENYFQDRAIKAALGSSYAQLELYQTLKNSTNGWSKSVNWKIANEMTRDEIELTDIGKFLLNVVGA